jgi:hypothetical protein
MTCGGLLVKTNEPKDYGRILEIVAAVVLGVAAVVAFGAQALSADEGTTQTEQVLFNLVQFILTVGFAWFSTRAISRREFEQGIRRFALAAYRRVADIDSLVERLRGEVSSMLAEAQPKPESELLVVQAMTVDTCQIIKSAIADWADVIGEELETLATIERLQFRKADVAGEPERAPTQVQTVDIENQIADLVSLLPAELQVDVRTKQQTAYADRHAAEWIADRHAGEHGLVLPAVTAAEYGHTRAWSTLERAERLTTARVKHGAVDVIDMNGKSVGRLQNISPLDYPDFMRALEVCYGVGALDLELVGSPTTEMRGGKEWAWIRVKVRNRPLVLTTREKIATWRREDVTERSHGA